MATPNLTNSNFNQIAITDAESNVLGVNIPSVTNFKVGGGQAGYALVSTGSGSNMAFQQVQQVEQIMLPEISWGFCRAHVYGNQIWRAGTRLGSWGTASGNPSNSLELFADRGGPAGFVKMALCNRILLALGTDGKLWGFGDGRVGALGNNSIAEDPYTVLTAATSPKLNGTGITVLNFWTNAVPPTDVSDSMAVTVYTHVNDNGTLRTYAYGNKNGFNNMTGSNTNPDPTTDPYEIPQFTGKSIVDGFVSVGTAMFVTSTGEVWGIGYNDQGSLGIGNNTAPDQFTQATLVNGSPVTGAAKVVIGWYQGVGVTSYILLQNGQVLAAGLGTGARLGNGSPTGNVNRFAPVQTAAGVNLLNITKIQAHLGGVGALDSTGNVWFTGTNWDGCWGNGAASSATSPFATIKQSGVSDFWILGGGPYGYVAAFYLDTVAASNGHRQLWAAGQNSDHQLGVGNVAEVSQLTKLQVPLPLGEYPVQMACLGGVTGLPYLGHHMITNANRYYVVGSPGAEITAIIGVPSLNTFHAISDFKK